MKKKKPNSLIVIIHMKDYSIFMSVEFKMKNEFNL